MPTEKGGVSIGQMRNLKLKWAFGFPGDITAFGAPTVFNGTVFTGSAGGNIYAIDAKTGCTHWVFEANGPVRMAILAVPNGTRTSLVFGDQIGWVYSLDALTGKQLWRKRIEEHEATRLTGSPVEHDGVVYIPAASWEETRSLDPQYPCCTFRGSLTALRVRDGSIAWKSYHDRRAQENRRDETRHRNLRPVRRRHLVRRDYRCQARRALRNHRRQLFAPGHQDQRRHRSASNQDRQDRVVAADAARRRLQFRLLG